MKFTLPSNICDLSSRLNVNWYYCTYIFHNYYCKLWCSYWTRVFVNALISVIYLYDFNSYINFCSYTWPLKCWIILISRQYLLASKNGKRLSLVDANTWLINRMNNVFIREYYIVKFFAFWKTFKLKYSSGRLHFRVYSLLGRV